MNKSETTKIDKLNSNDPKINLIVPLFNEEDVFHKLTERIDNLINQSEFSIEVILVDDGSIDKTPLLIKEKCEYDKNYIGVCLSRNFGHQLALTAGLRYATAKEAVLIIDGDLQDPPELLGKFFDYYKKGYDVVFAVRRKRKESVLKKISYKIFYRLMKKISYIDIPLDSGDFSLISMKVVDYLNQMPEESRFLRGMRSWIGFKQIGIEYEREERQDGQSKYSLKKLLKLALNGIFNFSEYPVKILIRLGLFSVLVSIAYLFYTMIMKLFFDSVPTGFTALLAVIILFGGVQLIGLGLLGEYILRIFFQVKNRPLFIVKDIYRAKKN
jgi:polyisoprenyl-phosphate glycosyltransferase